MYTDALLRVSSAQAVTATAVSTSSIDTATTFSSDFTQARSLGNGCSVMFHITTVVTATSAGATTVTFEAIGATDAALTAGIVVIGSSAAIAKAELDADAANTGLGNAIPIIVTINPQIWATNPALRYIGVRYTVAVANLTGGSFTADCVFDVSTSRAGAYKSGFTIA